MDKFIEWCIGIFVGVIALATVVVAIIGGVALCEWLFVPSTPSPIQTAVGRITDKGEMTKPVAYWIDVNGAEFDLQYDEWDSLQIGEKVRVSYQGDNVVLQLQKLGQ